ncbi:MAG: hypothetical protein JRI36_02855 [Deltaproteobacteria bacterium]|nr:hypothetical protein [Deltaproteobacteria bacterium]
MKKGYITAVVLAILLWTGFMVYRHHRNRDDTASYRQRRQKQMAEIAKKSPRGAMVLVGRALDRYHREHGSYPARLQDIYPKYLSNKALLEQTGFHYEPRGNDFYLSTTFTVGQREVLAYMEKDLRPQLDMGVMVAASAPKKRIKKAEKVVEPERAGVSMETRLALARENLINALRRGAFNVASVSTPDEEEQRLISAVMPKVVATSQETSGPGPEFDQRYLVWKGPSGVLGFSDVQYPDSRRLSIYAYGRWYDIKIPEPGEKTSRFPDATVRSKGPGEQDMLAGLERNFLIWKDRQGTIGFGNVNYPEERLSAVFDRHAWVAVKARPGPESTTVSERMGLARSEKSVDEVASILSNQVLVWRGSNGTLGFGNVDYPTDGTTFAYQDAQWVQLDRLAALNAKEKSPHAPEPKQSAETIAFRFGGDFLVWKGKDGILGFGNVQYPARDVQAVFDTGAWVRTGTSEPVEKRAGVRGNQEGAVGPHEDLAAAFSDRYLVWKDKHGTLGFGDTQYPEAKGLSGIHVDGGWETVAN